MDLVCLQAYIHSIPELFLAVETPLRSWQCKRLFRQERWNFWRKTRIIQTEEPIVIAGASFLRILGFNEVDFRLKFCTSLAI